MEPVVLNFIEATRRVGLGRAHEIVGLLMAYNFNSAPAPLLALSRRKAGKDFNALFEKTPESIKNPLTKEEESELDTSLQETYRRGDEHTPVLDATAEVKPNFSREVLKYFRENQGHTRNQCTMFLVEKYYMHYQGDKSLAARKIGYIVTNVIYTRKAELSSVMENGRGQGREAKIYFKG